MDAFFHSTFGFCFWDLLVLIGLVILLAVLFFASKRQRERERELEEQLAEKLAKDAVKK